MSFHFQHASDDVFIEISAPGMCSCSRTAFPMALRIDVPVCICKDTPPDLARAVAKQYVQAVLNVVRRETSFKFYLKSGVIKEPGQTVIDSCVGWFRLDSVIDAGASLPLCSPLNVKCPLNVESVGVGVCLLWC